MRPATFTFLVAIMPETERPQGFLHGAPPLVFVLGGPGSGKGTQCRKIVEEFHFDSICVGELLRREAHGGDDPVLRRYIEEVLQRGEIVPTAITMRLLHKACTEHVGTHRGILVDGFPRAIEQAEAFEREAGAGCAFALYFECSEQVLMGRLLARGQTSQRADDNMETIRMRLRTFYTTSMPVIERYQQQGKLVRLNAEREVEQVYAEVRRELLRRGFVK